MLTLWQVLSGITLARGQDILIRGQDDIIRSLAQIQPTSTIPDATYESQKKYPCDDGTRKEILDDIMEWVNDVSDTARCFFWLSGDPGVGKSAITASIAQACKRRKVLWAQFFINRNDARTVDPRLFFPSISQQMSRSSRAVDYAVQETLKDQPDLMNEDISIDQAKKLFVNTIRVASNSNPTSAVVIVIDALDETDFKRLEDTVEIFSQVIIDLPRNAKVFVSSRAEDVIRDIFAPQLTSARVRHMHLSANDSIPEVTRFLKRKVAAIMKKYHIDLSQWGEERTRQLCMQASGLFIWAVTAIEYIQVEIEQSGNECLDIVLDELNASGMDDINKLYLAILNRTYPREADLWAFQRFRRIMGAILVQQSPLCIMDLKGLLDLRNPSNKKPADIEHFVRRLRTVLVAGAGEINGQTVPRVHRSFSDFVTSAGAEGFRVDTISADGELAIRCLGQLDRLWELPEQLKLEMPAQYAVSHWSSHLARVVGLKVEEVDNDSISIPDAENIVLDQKKHTSAPVATEKPGRPEGGLFCITVSQDGTHIVSTWGQSIRLRDTQTGNDIVPPMLGHEDHVYFVAFSPDGKHIVSASDDHTICVWNSETGDMALGPMKGHTELVYSAVFSPDGRHIVSASGDKTICIWNSDTGDMVLGPLQGHTGSVRSAVFSPDRRLIVSASGDKTICIWNSDTGNMVLGPLEGHTHPVEFAVFSADGQHIVSCSNKGAILVWDSQTGERVPASSDPDAKLSFTNSETAPYIVTPLQGNTPLQGTSTSSYYFHLDNDDVTVGGVVNSGIDTWLYANHSLDFVMGRYLGQLILRTLWDS
jgi:WD40 repeat protein